jgi:uncharacterized protein (TIGR02246 family)
MGSDEQQIRELISTWMAASKAGDVQQVLSLMTDDAVFLLPGRPPMRKADFAAAAHAQAVEGAPQFDGKSEIQEVEVSGDFAFTWTKLTVTITPPTGQPVQRTGHTLSVLRRENGRWLLARDANLLGPAEPC